jgi:hypothetical protein
MNMQINTAPLDSTVSRIYAAREALRETDPPRERLGASQIGHPCDRYLWLQFRWAKRKAWDGRMLRLFERGQMEEPRVVADLRRIGCVVSAFADESTGRQHEVNFHGGHFGGSMDGAVQGIPEAPATWHVLEIKTHNKASFAKLQKDGVAAAKPEHVAQMQTYMAGTGMDRALYVAVNKDTDEVYTERVRADPVQAAKLIARGLRIVEAPEPPPPISADPAWWQCKGCEMHALCHEQANHQGDAPDVNCRTCAHATPITSAGDTTAPLRPWRCELKGIPIKVATQCTGCDEHRHMPMLLRWAELVEADSSTNFVGYRNLLTGERFNQGGADASHRYSSAEINAANDKRLIGAKDVRETKAIDSRARVVA